MAAKKQKKELPTKEAKTEKSDKLPLVEDLAEELFSLMGTKAKPDVFEDKKNDAIVVDVQNEEEAGLLIGNRGETLLSVQSILGMMFRQETGEWQRIIVNVSNWREKQENRLRELAAQTAERARALGEPQPLYNLTGSQRRIVHLALADDKDIETESFGEGEERYLVIRPKKKSTK
jgi:spoIIIJ-associated protein